MVRLVLAVNTALAITVTIFASILGVLAALPALEIMLKAFLGIGYLALAWATFKNNHDMERAFFVNLALVYLALAACSGMPYLSMWRAPTEISHVILATL